MRRLLWLAAWSVVAVWSLFAALAYGLVDLVGGLAMRNADLFASDPETVERIWRFFSFLHTASTSVALVIWGGVSLMILSVPWFIDRLAGRTTVVVGRGSVLNHGPSKWSRGAPDGVIDLPTDQYTVRPSSGAGPVPGIPPRR